MLKSRLVEVPSTTIHQNSILLSGQAFKFVFVRGRGRGTAGSPPRHPPEPLKRQKRQGMHRHRSPQAELTHQAVSFIIQGIVRLKPPRDKGGYTPDFTLRKPQNPVRPVKCQRCQVIFYTRKSGVPRYCLDCGELVREEHQRLWRQKDNIKKKQRQDTLPRSSCTSRPPRFYLSTNLP